MLFVLSSMVGLASSTTGPFTTMHKTFAYPALDVTDRGIEAVYPVLTEEQEAAGDVFPIIA